MENTKQQILSTSLRLFLEKNFKEVTMQEIITYSGVSKGAFYHYFKSKEQVFSEVVADFVLTFSSFDYASFSESTFSEFYNSYLHSLGLSITAMRKEKNTTDANYFLLVFDALRMLPEFKSEYIKQQQMENKAWQQIIKAAQTKGEITKKIKSKSIAPLFLCSFDGLYLRLLTKGTSKDLKKELTPIWNELYELLKNKK